MKSERKFPRGHDGNAEWVNEMKTVIINASPRKNWNTAQLLKEAQRGAESVGAEAEYVDLYDLKFTGCRSCLACKLKDFAHPGCAWKDELSPLIARILAADALIIGTPIYYGEPIAQLEAGVEIHVLAYNDRAAYIERGGRRGFVALRYLRRLS